MKLRKNLGAKVLACITSLTALGGIWALVHQNPPASAAPVATTDAASQRAASVAPGQRRAPAVAPSQAQVPQTHTRTHTSRSR